MEAKPWAIKLVRDELAKKVLGLILAGLAALAIVFWRLWAPAMSLAEWILSACLVATYVGIAARYAQRIKSFRHSWYPRSHPRYEVLREEVNYLIDANRVLTYSRRYRVKALVHDVDDYIGQFVWTGGDVGTPLPGAGLTAIEPRLEAGIWRYYTARFPRHLRKGETHEFEVVWPPITNWPSSSPFVSVSTDLPTRELVFTLDIPTASIRLPAFGEEMRGIESAFPFNVCDLTFDRGRLVWSPKTKLYRHYRLRWSWSEGADLERLSAPSVKGSE